MQNLKERFEKFTPSNYERVAENKIKITDDELQLIIPLVNVDCRYLSRDTAEVTFDPSFAAFLVKYYRSYFECYHYYLVIVRNSEIHAFNLEFTEP